MSKIILNQCKNFRLKILYRCREVVKSDILLTYDVNVPYLVQVKTSLTLCGFNHSPNYTDFYLDV